MSYNYEIVKLGDFANITMGQSPKGDTLTSDSKEMPFLQGNRTFGDKYPTIDTYTNSPTKIANKNSVLMSVRAPVGDLNIADKDICIGRGLCSLEANDLNNTYLYYLLKSVIPLLVQQSSGTVFSSVNRKDIANIEVSVPKDKNKQNKIANILSSFDKKIELNTSINTKLNELSECIINNMVNLSDLVIHVKDFVVNMRNGSTPRRNVDKYWNNGNIPWIKTGEVNNNFIYDTEEYITSEALKESSVSLLPANTVIMALYGSGTAGRVSIIKTEATTNQACTAMLCNSKVESYYLFMILKSMYKKIDSLTRGSVQQNLSKDIVGDLEIPLIDKEILHNSPLEKIFDMIANNTKENIALAELRDTLLPKLMSGEIEV